VNAFKVLGVGNLFEDPRVAGQPAGMLAPANRTWIRELLDSTFAAKARDEWLALLEAGDCPAGPLLDRDEWLDHEQVAANGLRIELDDPERGAVTMPGLTI